MAALKKFFGGSGSSGKEKVTESGAEHASDKISKPVSEAEREPSGSYSISTTGRIGLDVLYDPQDGATIDIVLVYGITGNRESTWTWENKGKKVFWPKDLLPSDVSKARIMTFGYDADVINFWKAWKPASHNSVEGHGTNLAKELMWARERTDSNDRSLIFIGHSLGGLVIESALLIANDSQDASLQKIAGRTRGVMFLGTPHYGSDLAKWAQYGASLLGLFRTVPRDLLSTLEGESQMLESMENRFANLRMRRAQSEKDSLKIACYYEELYIPGLGKVVVTKSSAAFLGSEAVGIHGTHMGMTRFESRNSSGYKSISNQLFVWARDLSRESNVSISELGGDVTTLSLSQGNLANLQFPPTVVDYKVEFLLPRHVVPKFVSRPNEMSKIVQAFKPGISSQERRRRVFVLHGLGGAGKTQMMLEYARCNKGAYTAIFWLNGATHSLIRQSLVDEASRVSSVELSEAFREYLLAQKDIPKTESSGNSPRTPLNFETMQDAIIAAFFNWLNHDGNSKWLFLIDNVDREYPSATGDQDAYDIERYFPRSDHGSIFITSRQLPLCALGDNLTLMRMEEDQGLQILAHRTGLNLSDLPTEAKYLVKRLGGLPLALAQAGAFIKSGASFNDYIALYDTKWSEIMGSNDAKNAQLKDYAHGTIGTTWSVSYEYIKQKDSMASTLIDILAFFQGSDIYREMFVIDADHKPVNFKKPIPKFIEEIYNTTAFQRMIRLLVEFAFLHPKSSRDGYEMHPVLQDWCLFSKSQTERDEISVLAMRLIGSSAKYLDHVDWRLARPQRERLSSHLSRCIALLEKHIEIKAVDLAEPILLHFHSIAWLFAMLEKREEALLLFERAYRGISVLRGLQHNTTKWLAISYAAQCIHRDRLADAEAVLEPILLENQAAGIEEDIQLVNISLTLASSYGKHGRAKEAEEMFRRSLSQLPSAKGSSEWNLIFARTRFGEFLASEKRYLEAAEVFSEAIPAARAFAPKLTYWELACDKLVGSYKKLRRFAEAERVLLDTVRYFESNYGIADHWTQVTIRYLGDIYRDMENFDKAEVEFRRILSYEQEEENSKWMMQHLLADTLRSQRKFKESEDLFIKTLQERENGLGADHLDSLHTRYGLCLVFEDTVRIKEAEQQCSMALEGRKKQILDEKDPLLLSYRNALANFWRKQGKLIEAEQSQVEIWELRQQVLGPKDLDTLRTKHLLSLTLEELKKYEEAAKMARENYRDRTEVLGKTHTDTHASGQLLSRCLWLSGGREEEAISITEQVLSTMEQSFDVTNRELVVPLYQLGKQYMATNRHFEAEKLFKRCLTIEEKELGPYHKDVAQTLVQIGVCLREQERFNESVEVLERYCTIMYEHLKVGPENLEASDGLCWLGLSYMQQEPGDLVAAKAALEKCVEYRNLSLPHEHTARLMATTFLAAINHEQGHHALVASQLAPITDLLITPTPRSSINAISTNFRGLGEAYWGLEQYQNARKPYRRLLAYQLIEFNDLRFPMAIRAALDHSTIQVYLEEKGFHPLTEKLPEGTPCISCDGCAAGKPLLGPFYYCLICEDVALCPTCMSYYQRQNEAKLAVPGQFPMDDASDDCDEEGGLAITGCDPSHEFLEIPRHIWGPSGPIKGQVDLDGTIYESWFAKMKEEFLTQMVLDDPLWMRCLRQGQENNAS